MRRRVLVVVLAVLTAASMGQIAEADVGIGPGGGTPGTSSNFQLIGHHSLFNRGMNAAMAIFGHFAYIGNRTDGSRTCGVGDPRGPGDNCPHVRPGILIVDVKKPAKPKVVGEIRSPYAGLTGISTRELRVWPDKKLLVVMSFRCSSVIHACPPGTDTQFPFDLKFFDLSKPRKPKFLSSYVPTSAAGLAVKPHEMFLWVDPNEEDRGLLYLSTPTVSVDATIPNLMIVDISQVPSGGPVTEVAEGNWNDRYPGAEDPANYDFNLIVHSMGLSADGTRAYLAMEAGEFLVLDTSDVAANLSDPELRLLTDPVDRPIWGNPVPGCENTCPNGHSAVQVPGKDLSLTTDEVYGKFTDPSFGCPWGWSRLIDVSDPAHPVIVGEYKTAEDDAATFCGSEGDDEDTENFTSYSSHNPTVLPDVALIDWHSDGVQAVDISDPVHPAQGGWFSPTPLASVATEDPALSRGPNKVVMWSYPIIKNGLIYVIDIRNGLYILKYTGPQSEEVDDISFYEGNSNLGDAIELGEG
jgi:hypothetical protein